MSTAEHALLNPSEAARRLGVSAKALRLYEQRGLLSPARTPAGWRVYGPAELRRAARVVALRALGFSLAQVGRAVQGDPAGLDPLLAAHQAGLESRLHELARTVARVRSLRGELAQGRMPSLAELAGLGEPGELGALGPPPGAPHAAFELPWPWGGERFELRQIRALNYIIGPLGSGKTRLARCLAQALPGARWLGLERLERLERDAAPPAALRVLLGALAAPAQGPLVIDMIEQGLDLSTQQALMARLRARGAGARPIFMLTRSSAILDLAAVGADETIILCPANHSPPMHVPALPGAPGFEAVATCLASPEVRARTAGVIAWRQAPSPLS